MGDGTIPSEPKSGTHLTVERVSAQAVLEHLSSDTQVASSFGADLERARDGTDRASNYVQQQSRAEERLLARAAVFRCVDALAATEQLTRTGDGCNAIRQFADRAMMGHGRAVVMVLKAFQPWASQWPEQGLAATYEAMRRAVPALAEVDVGGEASTAQAFRVGKAKKARHQAALLVSEATIILSAWCERWNRRGHRVGANAA